MKLSLLLTAALCLPTSLFASSWTVKAPIDGFLTDPSLSLGMIAANQGFSSVETSLASIRAQFGDRLVAIGSQSYKGEAIIYTTDFYEKREDGTLKPVATVQGYLLGGDEFTVSKPGHAVFTAK